MTPFDDPNVAAKFDAMPSDIRPLVLQSRDLILNTAHQDARIGPLQETLKWGQPAYLPVNKSGTTLRLGLPKQGGFGIYTHCQTTVISDFQAQFPTEFTYEGNRAILFKEANDLHLDLLQLFVVSALTYHLKPG